MEKNLVVDSERMYRLFHDEAGKLCLGVMSGGFAMYEVTFPLSEAEAEQYQALGKKFLDQLSLEAARNPEEFIARGK